MGEARRKFDKDFRDGAVRLVRETGKPIAHAVTGSWHSTLESGLRSLRQFATRAQALTAVAAWTGESRHRPSCAR